MGILFSVMGRFPRLEGLRMKSDKTAVVLGVSRKTESYAFKALQRLKAVGYPVIPVNPSYEDIAGIPCVPNLEQALKGDFHSRNRKHRAAEGLG